MKKTKVDPPRRTKIADEAVKSNGSVGSEISQVAVLEEKCRELEEGWRRTQAEFLNYKTRTEKEKMELADFIRAEVVRDILPIYDNLRRGCQMVADKTGYEMVINAFLDLLKNKYQIVPMDCGKDFDTQRCEAIGLTEGEGKSGEIAEVVETGFVCGEKIIRPAKVLIYK